MVREAMLPFALAFGLWSLPAALGASVATDYHRPILMMSTDEPEAWRGSCHAVVVDTSTAPEHVANVRAIVPEHCRLFVYDVGEAYMDHVRDPSELRHCQLPPLANMQCTAILNRGREFGALLHHLLHVSYADPPEWTMLIPSTLDRHNRTWHLEQMLNETVLRPAGAPSNFWCIRGSPRPDDPPNLERGRASALREMLGFRGNVAAMTRPDWAELSDTRRVEPCYPKTLGDWLDVHVTQQQQPFYKYNTTTIVRQCAEVRACNFGLLATPRADVLAYPRHVYEHLFDEMHNYPAPNSAYLVEKAAHVVFGPRDASARCAPAREKVV